MTGRTSFITRHCRAGDSCLVSNLPWQTYLTVNSSNNMAKPGVFNAQAQNRQQLFGENQAVADFLLRKQMSLAGLSNQNAAMAQGLLQPQQFGVEGVNAAGIINDVNASKNAMLSGLTQSGASLAAAAIASDSRLKIIFSE